MVWFLLTAHFQPSPYPKRLGIRLSGPGPKLDCFIYRVSGIVVYVCLVAFDSQLVK